MCVEIMVQSLILYNGSSSVIILKTSQSDLNGLHNLANKAVLSAMTILWISGKDNFRQGLTLDIAPLIPGASAA